MSQSGNALFIILIAVALLAALSYAITQSSQGGKGINSEQSRLYASEIMEYAQIVGNAVAQLRLRGCSETEISFENDIVAGYTNGTNTACQIFHPDGGGINYASPPSESMDVTATPDYQWHFFTGNAVQNIGTTGSTNENMDLILVVNELSLTICQTINKLLNVGSVGAVPDTDDAMAENLFTGTHSGNIIIGNEATAISGKTSGCFYEDEDSKYTFYKVLIAR